MQALFSPLDTFMRKGKDPRSRSRIRTSDLWIRIREAQKHADPVDPDPQHWLWFYCEKSDEGNVQISQIIPGGEVWGGGRGGAGGWGCSPELGRDTVSPFLKGGTDSKIIK